MKSRAQIIRLLSAACATLPAAAELNFPQVVLDASFVAYERDVGDIDGDGLNDVVATSDGGTAIEWFRAPDWNRATLVTLTGTYRYTRADDFKVADVDGDNDADLVVRLGSGPSDDGEGRAAWIENLGSGTGWVTRIIGTSPSYGKDIAVGDLDRDGRLDLVYREDSLTQIWFNETNGWTEVALNHTDHEGMELGDLDMDGDLDVVLNGFWFATPNTPATCRMAGNYTQATIDAQWFSQSGDWTANSCKVSVGDLDGDGTNDVVFSQSERAGYAVTWYKRNGAAWTAHPVAPVDYAHNLQAYDADLDGDLDLLTGGMPQSSHKGLRLYLNDGTGTNWTLFPIQSDGSYSAELGDIDNDGDLDIVGVINWNAAPSYIYRSNAGGPPSLDFWQYLEVTDQHLQTFGLAAYDVDGDGDLDLPSGPYVYRNPGGAMTGAWTRTSFSGAGHVFLATDVDGDNRADLLTQLENAGANRIDLYWVEAADPGASAWTTPILIGNVPRSDHSLGFQGWKLAQIESGGSPEVVISSYQGVYYFRIPVNPSAGSWPRVLVAANDSDEGIGVDDIDDDGDLDLGFASGNSKNVMWARNPGNGSSNWNVFTIGTFPEADWIDRCEAVDLNGDGRADLIATEENQSGSPDALAVWWEQPATSPTNGSWTRRTITTRYTLNSMDVADVDKDGDPDVVLAEHQGAKRISVFANNGTGTFTEFAVGAGKENHLGGRLLDLDGDGDLDLAGIAYNDSSYLHVWRNDSPGGTPTAARPTISPNGGVFDEPVAVTLSCSTTGVTIRYTTNGTDPTDGSTPYSSPLAIATTTTLRARAFRADLDPSPIASATFTGPQVQTPIITPPGGTFSGTQTVTLACATTGVVIRYTTNGTDPTDASEAYTGSLLFTNSTTLRARAFRTGLAPSAEASASFTLFTLGAAAHWRFDERFGTTAYDDSGGGHHATIAGASRVAGHQNRALSLDGVDDRIEAGTWEVSGTSLTLCAWVRIRAPYDVNRDARIVSKATGSTEQDHVWMLSLTTAGADIRPRFRLKTGGTTTTLVPSSGSLAQDTWLHLAATYDGSAMRLFVNGTQAATQAKSGDITASAAAIFLGANPPSGSAALAGDLDDVRIYNTALDSGNLQAVMNEAPPDATWLDNAVLVDFGINTNLTVSPDPNGNVWNNLSTDTSAAPPGTAHYLTNLVGSPAGVRLLLSGFGTGANAAGTTVPDAALGILAITNATRDSFFVNAGSPATLSFTGLVANGLYQLDCFGSRDAVDTRSTRYTATGAATSMAVLVTSGTGIGLAPQAHANRATIARLTHVRPTGTGTLQLTVSAESGSFGYLGALYLVRTGTVETVSNQPPTASGVTLVGAPRVGTLITAFYTYADAEGDAEGTTRFQWQSTASTNDVPSTMAGATNAAYSATATELGKFLRLTLTPVAVSGTRTGSTAVSSWLGPLAATNALTVFHIGNSFTRWGNIPAQLQDFAAASNRPHARGEQLADGQGVGYHWTNGLPGGLLTRGTPARTELATASWDALILQPMSREWQPASLPAFQANAESFDNLADSAGVQLYLYVYWPWRDDPLSDQDGINAAFEQVRSALSSDGPPVRVIPVGEAFRAAVGEMGSGELAGLTRNDLYRDTLHPSDIGYYLSALVHFAVLHRRSPVGLPAVGISSDDFSDAPVAIPTNIAAAFQRIAWEVARTTPYTGITRGRFDEWAAASGLPGNGAPADEPYGDGIPNLARWAFGMGSGAGTDIDHLPRIARAPDGRIEIQYGLGSDAWDAGIVFTHQWSTDLTSWLMPPPDNLDIQESGNMRRITFPADGSLRTFRCRVEWPH
jgi:hypothetical protein